MAPADDHARRCSECGASLDARDRRCWLCERDLPAGSDSTNPYASPAAARETPPAGLAQFSLSSLMLVRTLVAVCLGVTMLAPGLGIGLIVLATPAFVRTMVAGLRSKQAGVALTPAEKVGAFLLSLAIMACIAVAAVVAFQVACWGSCALAASIGGEGEGAMWLGIVLGTAAGLGTLGWLLWISRPTKPEGL
jgi:hypothetical protein